MQNTEDFRIKLIFPCAFERYDLYAFQTIKMLPYGMGVITASLRRCGYDVEQVDLAAKFNCRGYEDLDFLLNRDTIQKFLISGKIESEFDRLMEQVLDYASLEGFHIIGFSILSRFNFFFALMFSRKIKEIKNTPIVLGGPFITLFGHLYPEAFNSVDYMIEGDGAMALLKLIDCLKNSIAISEVPNLIYRSNGKLITNPNTCYPLEDMPLPDFDGLSLKPYTPRGSNLSLPYQITRGCSAQCSFCAPMGKNNRLEFKSYDKIVREIGQMRDKYRSPFLRFCDDDITASYRYLEGLCDIFIKKKLQIQWHVYAKVGNLDKHLLRKMKQAGCQTLTFGIESGSNTVLKNMNKGFTIEKARQTLKETSSTGIRNIICLIAGYPHETNEDIIRTEGFIKRNSKYIDKIAVRQFALTYGSPIYYHPESFGIKNLRQTSHSLRFYYNFDECEGLEWEDKERQIIASKKHIVNVVKRYLKPRLKWKILIPLSYKTFKFIVRRTKNYVRYTEKRKKWKLLIFLPYLVSKSVVHRLKKYV